MGAWLQQCPACGYVDYDLSTVVRDAKRTIESASYRDLSAASAIPALARRFARYALLQRAKPEAAGFALIRAAWACDDAKSQAEGKKFRSQSADILLALQPFGEPQATLATVLVDVLRRAERFGEAKSLATTLGSLDAVQANKIMVAVLQYECRLCDKGDTGCYTIADAEKAGRP